MTRSQISSTSRSLVLDRLAPIVGPSERMGSRGACYLGPGSLFMIRTADSSTCAPDGRLHWTKVDRENRQAIEERAREAERTSRPFDIVLATLLEDERELLIWAVPFEILNDAIGHDALYIRLDSWGRHVAEIAGRVRPLGDLDLRAYLFRCELTDEELEKVRAARLRQN